MLVVGDIEFSFFSGSSDAELQSVTISIETGDGHGGEACSYLDVMRAVRCFQEKLLHRSVDSYFQPIASLDSYVVLGYEALGPTDQRWRGSVTADSLLLATECHLTGRLHQLHRTAAADEASVWLADGYLFLKVDPKEIGSDGLTESLVKLHEDNFEGRGLVVEVADSVVCDTQHFRYFLNQLRSAGIRIAYDGFASGHAQVMEHKDYPADFLKLSPSVARDVCHSGERQRQIEAVVRAAQEIGCEVVATGIQSRPQADICRELGCQYGQGELIGDAQSSHSLLKATEACNTLPT